ncbi:hypothetical protein HG530_012688 [Fusarium avenaceum]|nr:hypothetical protein HG530_012688 [Fusarium avenaceum]
MLLQTIIVIVHESTQQWSSTPRFFLSSQIQRLVLFVAIHIANIRPHGLGGHRLNGVVPQAAKASLDPTLDLSLRDLDLRGAGLVFSSNLEASHALRQSRVNNNRRGPDLLLGRLLGLPHGLDPVLLLMLEDKLLLILTICLAPLTGGGGETYSGDLTADLVCELTTVEETVQTDEGVAEAETVRKWDGVCGRELGGDLGGEASERVVGGGVVGEWLRWSFRLLLFIFLLLVLLLILPLFGLVAHNPGNLRS